MGVIRAPCRVTVHPLILRRSRVGLAPRAYLNGGGRLGLWNPYEAAIGLQPWKRVKQTWVLQLSTKEGALRHLHWSTWELIPGRRVALQKGDDA